MPGLGRRLLHYFPPMMAIILSTQLSHVKTVEPSVLLGLYTTGSLQVTASEIDDINDWLGSIDQRISIAGTFMDFEWPNPEYNVHAELNAAWDHSAVPFINLNVGTLTDPEMISQLPESEGYPNNRTAAMVATDEDLQDAILIWAKEFANWSNGGKKKAFIAPLPEMNGDWTSYSLTPEDYIQAFLQIQSIFNDADVPENAVNWVFAPNGWSDTENGHPGFEDYYPGNSAVDVVAFSSYNFGTCVWNWPSWDSFDQAFEPYLERMRAMAPSKPIFISQTGTVDEGGDKDLWLKDSYTKLAAYPALRGIIYFHKQHQLGLPCDPVDWRFYAPSEQIEFTGLLEALQDPQAGFGYWSLANEAWENLVFNPSLQLHTFDDVEPSLPFAGVDDVWYLSWIEALVDAELTDGCGPHPITGMKMYCPTSSSTRAELAVFLLRGTHGPHYTPPIPDGSSPFTDIAGHWAEGWIEALYDEGLTSGYEDQTYRPNYLVTRAEMATFILKAKYGSSYSPPPVTGDIFIDISGHWAEEWIEQLDQEGIVSGYPDGSYRPENSINRAEIAVYTLRGFDLTEE